MARVTIEYSEGAREAVGEAVRRLMSIPRGGVTVAEVSDGEAKYQEIHDEILKQLKLAADLGHYNEALTWAQTLRELRA